MIGNLQNWSRRHPRSVAALIFGAFAAVIILPSIFAGPNPLTDPINTVSIDQLLLGVMWQTVLCLILLTLTVVLRWQDIVGFAGPFDRGGLISFLVLLFVPTLFLLVPMIGLMGDGLTNSPLRIIMLILSLNAMVGLSEELLFRGFMFGALRQKHRLITAIIISSVVFGLIHVANLGIGQSAMVTGYQVVNAVVLGALFCAVMLQTNSLWPPILLHMIWNSSVMLGLYSEERLRSSSGETPIAPSSFGLEYLVWPAILVIITVIVLWRYQKRTGQDLWTVRPTAQQPGT